MLKDILVSKSPFQMLPAQGCMQDVCDPLAVSTRINLICSLCFMNALHMRQQQLFHSCNTTEALSYSY